MLPASARTSGPVVWAALVAVVMVAGWTLASPPAPDQVHWLIEEILSSPGYQVNPPLSWVIERWLLHQLQRLLEALAALSHSGPLAGLPGWVWWIIVGASIVLLGLILAHLVVSVRGLMLEPRRGRMERTAADRPRDPEQVLREAEVAAAAGQFGLALRLLYEAALRRLDRLQVLRYDPARTNWENLRAAVLSRPGLHVDLGALTAAVDGCVYGGQPATSDLFAHYRDLVDRLWRAEVPANG